MKAISKFINWSIDWFSIITQLMFLSTQTIAQNTWMQKANFEGGDRYGAVAFSIKGKGYVATGNDVTTGLENDLWEYDPLNDSWMQKADLPGEERTYAVGFAIEDYGYVGTGASGSNLDDFWQYDPVSNTWTQKADFGGGKRYAATGFSIGKKGYLGTGYNGGSIQRKDFYEYDPVTDTWTKKADVGGVGRWHAVSFVIGERGYIGTAKISDPLYENDLWEYDPTTDTWSEKATMPGPNRLGAEAFAIAGKGYVIGGKDAENDVTLGDIYEYNPSTDSWTQKEDLPGETRYHAVAFAVGNKGYIGTGELSDNIYLNDFWEYTPDCETPSGLTTSNIKSASAKVNWNAVPLAQKYSVRYRNTGTLPWTKTTANANFKKLAGLSPDTQYDWAVKSVCDAVNNVSSDWSATQTFTTKPLRIGDEGEEDGFPEVYPNPVSGSGTLSFSLEENSHIMVELFDVTGRRISKLVEEEFEAGAYEFPLNTDQLAAGNYLLRLTTETSQSTLKLVVE